VAARLAARLPAPRSRVLPSFPALPDLQSPAGFRGCRKRHSADEETGTCVPPGPRNPAIPRRPSDKIDSLFSRLCRRSRVPLGPGGARNMLLPEPVRNRSPQKGWPQGPTLGVTGLPAAKRGRTLGRDSHTARVRHCAALRGFRRRPSIPTTYDEAQTPLTSGWKELHSNVALR
jgi:hypothetical protein